MADAAGAIDPLAAMLARTDLEQASAIRAPAPVDGRSVLDTARRIGRVLHLAAVKLDISHWADLDELCRLILARARAGGLSPRHYRVTWLLLHGARRAAPGGNGEGNDG
jgi:hypothetical protein